jgi:hypothetical protein
MTSRSPPFQIPEIITYVLDGKGKPVREPDMGKFGKFLTSDAKIVKQDVLMNGHVFVSTVFSGVDYRSPPRLWETVILGGPHDGYERRYTSREAALAGHKEAAALASGSRH